MIDLQKIRHIHFVGIGGIMMSGIAEILNKRSYIVTGSDQNSSFITDHLIKLGISINFNHVEDNVIGPDLIVYSSAVPDNNIELIKARELNLDIITRAEMIGVLMPEYNTSIAIAGAHGKTTSTSMLSTILNDSDHNPTILIGGIASTIGSNVQIGDTSIFLLEACEYKENFLEFKPNIGIILNIDEDHLDYFEDLDHIIRAFTKFAKNIPSNGTLIINNDDYNAKKIISHVDCEVITFGINSNSTFQAKHIVFDDNGHSQFEVFYKEDLLGAFQLKFPGKHNIYNVLSTIAASYKLNIKTNKIIESVKSYAGVRRRFEILGTYNGATIIDDYAHHPTEIKSVLAAAKKIPNNKVVCIFQPHTYSRTRNLMLQFSTAFNDADSIIITDIYSPPGREDESDKTIHSTDLVAEIASETNKVKYIGDLDAAVDFILATAQPNDIILTLGAGNIRSVGEKIINSKQLI